TTMTLANLVETMQGRFNTAAATGLNKIIQWNITGEQAGIWAFHISNGTGQLIPGGVEKPDVTFTTSAKDWISIAEGKLDPMKAFMTGKLKVTGDMMLAMKMPQFFPIEQQ